MNRGFLICAWRNANEDKNFLELPSWEGERLYKEEQSTRGHCFYSISRLTHCSFIYCYVFHVNQPLAPRSRHHQVKFLRALSVPLSLDIKKSPIFNSPKPRASTLSKNHFLQYYILWCFFNNFVTKSLEFCLQYKNKKKLEKRFYKWWIVISNLDILYR